MGKSAVQESLPNLTAVFLVALTASALLWLEGDSPVGALVILSVVFTPILVYFLTASFQAAVGVMIAAAAASHYVMPISGLNVAPEHLAIAVLCIILPIWLKRDSQRPIWNIVDGLLVAYILLNLVSSVFMSVAPGQNLRWAIQQAMVILPYFLVRFFLTDRQRFEKAFRIFVVIGTMQAAYAIVCFFSSIFFGTDFGMALDQYGQIPGTYGMQREANILGAYSCGCFVTLLVMYFKAPRVRLLVGVAITWAAVMISLSRGAIGAAGIVCLAAVFYGTKKKLLSGQLLVRVVVTVVLTTFLLAPALAPSYSERATESAVSDPMEDTNVKLRVFQAAVAMEDIIAHPVLGNGTASFQLSFSYEDLGYGEVDQGAWISNVEMRVLHDTGIIGFAAFALFVGFLLVRSWKVAQREFSTELLALFFSALVFAITFQATEATLLSFGWVHLGLMGSGLAAYTARQRPSLVTEARFK